jgi:hypothetical protein
MVAAGSTVRGKDRSLPAAARSGAPPDCPEMGLGSFARLSKLVLAKGQKKGEDSASVVAFPEKERTEPKESFASDQSSKHLQPDPTVVPAAGI